MTRSRSSPVRTRAPRARSSRCSSTDVDRLIVEGVNRVKRHTRAGQDGQGSTGGIITVEAPIHVSNVMLVVGEGAKKSTTRVGYRREDVTKTRPDGSTYAAQRSVRVARKTGKDI